MPRLSDRKTRHAPRAPYFRRADGSFVMDLALRRLSISRTALLPRTELLLSSSNEASGPFAEAAFRAEVSSDAEPPMVGSPPRSADLCPVDVGLFRGQNRSAIALVQLGSQ